MDKRFFLALVLTAIVIVATPLLFPGANRRPANHHHHVPLLKYPSIPHFGISIHFNQVINEAFIRFYSHQVSLVF